MTLVTVDTLKVMYKMFCNLPPFDKYTLPHASQIEWLIVNDPDMYGQYQPEPHAITISTARCGHLDTIQRTLVHEMVHMILYLQGKRYELHNKNFFNFTNKIATLYGWDPKEL